MKEKWGPCAPLFFVCGGWMTLVARLETVLTPVVESMGLILYGIECHGGVSAQPTLVVYIDGPTGATVDDCSRISREVGALLDVEYPFRGRYRLEVSSPGLERPLLTRLHYEQSLSHRVRLRLREPMQGQRQWEGVVQAVSDAGVSLLLDAGEVVELQWDKLEKGRWVAELRGVKR